MSWVEYLDVWFKEMQFTVAVVQVFYLQDLHFRDISVNSVSSHMTISLLCLSHTPSRPHTPPCFRCVGSDWDHRLFLCFDSFLMLNWLDGCFLLLVSGQLKDLGLLERCLKETLRLRPPIMTMMRMARSPQVRAPPSSSELAPHRNSDSRSFQICP